MEKLHETHAKVFKALCDEKRLSILELLRGGEKCACVLSDLTNIKQSALSYHMKLLCESGIVESWQDGKWTNYRLSKTGQERASALLVAITTPNSQQLPNSHFLDKMAPELDKSV